MIPLKDRLLALADKSELGALIVGQHDIRVAGAGSQVTFKKWQSHTSHVGQFFVEHGTLDASAFDALFLMLEASGLAPVAKRNYWKCAKSLATGLMARGKIPFFKIPWRYSDGEVKAATPPPENIASGLAPGVTGVKDGDLLLELVKWCYGQFDEWDRLRELGREIIAASADAFRAALGQAEIGFERISMPQDWIARFVAAHGDGMAELEIPTEPNDLSGLAFCLHYATLRFDGVPLTITQARAVDDGTALARSYCHRVSRLGMAAPGVFTAMMVPGHHQAAVLAILLASVLISSLSALNMVSECIKPTARPGVSELVWPKGRSPQEPAGQELADLSQKEHPGSLDGFDGQESAEFRDAGIGRPSWSIISVVRRYKNAAEPLRRRLSLGNENRSKLLLAQPTKAKLADLPEVVKIESLCREVRAVAALFAAEAAKSNPQLAGLNFTLEAVRVSAMQDHNRRSGSLEKTRQVSKHAGRGTTAIYLRNPVLQSEGTARIREIQGKLGAAIRSGTLIVAPERAPASIEEIGHGIACRDRKAGVAPNQRKGRPCDAFLGCLACPNAIIIATPLSYALLSRFRDHLTTPGERDDREPERHARWVASAVELATRALSEFPPAIAREGAALAERLNVSFGGIW